MAAGVITRVGAAAGDGTTITIPAGHQNGDLVFIYAYRTALTAPTLPAGFTAVGTASTNASSYRAGVKLAASSSETSGTWTNATGLICAVYRNVSTIKTPYGTQATTTNVGSATANYLTTSLTCPGTSWLLAFGAVSSITTTLENAPAGLTNIATAVGAAAEYAAHDSNGAYNSASWPTTGTALGTSAEWRTWIIELYAESLAPMNNYQQFKVGDGMSTSEKIR